MSTGERPQRRAARTHLSQGQARSCRDDAELAICLDLVADLRVSRRSLATLRDTHVSGSTVIFGRLQLSFMSSLLILRQLTTASTFLCSP